MKKEFECEISNVQQQEKLIGQVNNQAKDNGEVVNNKSAEYVNEYEWHNNTELSVDLKTMLCSDRCIQNSKEYLGILRRDSWAVADEFLCRDSQYTFIEIVPTTNGKRNPHVFRGKFITVTQRDDGTLHPNFRLMNVDKDFILERYAVGVSNELLLALKILMKK